MPPTTGPTRTQLDAALARHPIDQPCRQMVSELTDGLARHLQPPAPDADGRWPEAAALAYLEAVHAWLETRLDEAVQAWPPVRWLLLLREASAEMVYGKAPASLVQLRRISEAISA